MIVFGAMGGLVATYLTWLIVHGPGLPQIGSINGWGVDAFGLVACLVCATGGRVHRPGSYVPLVFALALLCWTLSSTVLTIYALHGPTPPPPTLADPFGFGFIVLCFAGIWLMAREERERLSPRDVLDAGIVALGAGAVCAAFVLARLPRQAGQSTLGAAVELVYPIAYVVLVLLVVGASMAVGQRRSQPAWIALTAGFVLLAMPAALHAVTGNSRSSAFLIVFLVAMPAATLLIAASMWIDPGVPDPTAVRKGIAVWIPALACAAAIAVLFAATLGRIDHPASALATGALLLVMVRGISELRHEIRAREETEKSLRASETGFRRLADEQAALRRVATLVAHGDAPEAVFAAVAEEVGRLVLADYAFVSRYHDGDHVTLLAEWTASPDLGALRASAKLGGRNVVTLVYETRRPARLGSYADASGEAAQVAQDVAIRISVAAPIIVSGSLWGVIIASSKHQDALPAGAEERLAEFTELVATAIANAETQAELNHSRARIVATADETRRRIVRDLHDGAQQRLVHTIITLKLARRQLAGADVTAGGLIDEALDHAERANAELRELAHGILPSVLARGGLTAGVRELVSRLRVPVDLNLDSDRLPPEVEANAYFVIAEALTNVVKHSGAHRASVTACVEGGILRVEVRDDGIGGARPDGGGLLGLGDRVAALGGSLQIQSPPGQGTTIRIMLPVRHHPPGPAPAANGAHIAAGSPAHTAGSPSR